MTKLKNNLLVFVFVAGCAVLILPFLNGKGSAVYSQAGNSISGIVFGVGRQPLGEVYVELMDEFSRTLQRARTNGSGRYAFYQLGSGRFKVRVLPYATDYEEQEQDVEIINFSHPSTDGTVQFGFSNEV